MIEQEALAKFQLKSTQHAVHVPIIITLSQDEQILAVGSQDNVIFLYGMPLHQKLIALKIGQYGFPIGMFITPCNSTLIVFTYEMIDDGQIYKLLVFDIKKIVQRIEADIMYAKQCYDGEKFILQIVDPIINFILPENFLSSDMYIYKILAQNYQYMPDLQSAQFVVHCYSSVILLNVNFMKSTLVTQPIQCLLDITPEMFHKLQDVSLIKQKYMLLQFSSNILLLQQNKRNCESPYIITSVLNDKNELTDTFDSQGSLQVFQSFLIEFRNKSDDYFGIGGATHYFENLNQARQFIRSGEIAQIWFPNSFVCQLNESQIVFFKFVSSSAAIPVEHRFQQLVLRTAPGLMAENNMNYLSLKQLQKVSSVFDLTLKTMQTENIYDLYSFNSKTLSIQSEFCVSINSVSTYSQGTSYFVQKLAEPALYYNHGYLLTEKQIIQLGHMKYQNYSAFFNGFQVIGQNVLFYEREDEFDEFPDNVLYDKVEPRSIERIQNSVKALKGFTEVEYDGWEL
ncbi:Conserved_hypothetical protein [Hexamita inflata]|uniref:Uncharacterized protein n=1 Tax=Hexamita inflata TaxID=28002 RepID=A0AA86TZP7_9EUKA|nr:Conserved hypothetical protein [Hexamita inflata]